MLRAEKSANLGHNLATVGRAVPGYTSRLLNPAVRQGIPLSGIFTLRRDPLATQWLLESVTDN